MTEEPVKKNAGGRPPNSKSEFVLPLAKIKTIMKSSPDIEYVSADSLVVVTKMTELFVAYLAKEAASGNTLDYKDLSEFVHRNNHLEFLSDTVPLKVPARVALQEVTKKNSLCYSEFME